MPIDRRTFIGSLPALGLAGAAAAQTHPAPPPAQWPPAEHFPLWPGLPPGAPSPLPAANNSRDGWHGEELWLRGVANPVVGVYRPKKPDGRAVLVIPGGGYNFVSVSNEGIDVAHALTPFGITAFVLAYRLPGEGWANRADVPLADGQRAMRLIRANAARYAIDPAKLGIAGFSAGGHLGAMLATAHGDVAYAPVDATDRVSARPDFAGLFYPVVRFGSPSRSAEALFDANPDPAMLAQRTPLNRVAAGMPPIFLGHAMDDGTVPIARSIAFIEACLAAKVPIEAHLFEHGGHGFGGAHAPEGSPARLWPELFARWSARSG